MFKDIFLLLAQITIREKYFTKDTLRMALTNYLFGSPMPDRDNLAFLTKNYQSLKEGLDAWHDLSGTDYVHNFSSKNNVSNTTIEAIETGKLNDYWNPKITGDYEKEPIFVPFCSFGSFINMTNCSFLQPAIITK